MYRNRLAVILIFLLLFMQLTPKKASANPIAISAAASVVVTALLSAVGYSATSEAGKRASTQFTWENLSESTREYINRKAIDLAAGAVAVDMLLTDGIITEFITGRDRLLDMSANHEGITFSDAQTMPIQSMTIPESERQYGKWACNVTGTTGAYSAAGYVEMRLTPSGNPAIRIGWDKAIVGGSIVNVTLLQVHSNTGVLYPNTAIETLSGGGITMPFHEIAVIVDEYLIQYYIDGEMIVSEPNTNHYKVSAIYKEGSTVQGTISYEYDNTVILQEGTDYTTDSAKVENPNLSQSLTGTTISITNTGDTTTTIVTPETANQETGAITGWLSTLWNTVSNGFQNVLNKMGQISTSITTPLEALKTGVLTISTAITTFFDPTIPINWEPIKAIGFSFTRAFPFSLPWDIYRSFSSLVSSEWDGKIPVNVNSGIVSMNFEISFDWFDSIIGSVRLIELLLFDVGLILATRKLLGGAA